MSSAARARACVRELWGLAPDWRPELGPVVSDEYLNEQTNGRALARSVSSRLSFSRRFAHYTQICRQKPPVFTPTTSYWPVGKTKLACSEPLLFDSTTAHASYHPTPGSHSSVQAAMKLHSGSLSGSLPLLLMIIKLVCVWIYGFMISLLEMRYWCPCAFAFLRTLA